MPNSIVTNLSTNEATSSNAKGRYRILAQKNDILRLEGDGCQKLILKLQGKTIVNIAMTSD